MEAMSDQAQHKLHYCDKHDPSGELHSVLILYPEVALSAGAQC